MNKLPSKSEKIIFDACIFMVDISLQNYNFRTIQSALLDPCFEYFDTIFIHEYVYNNELDFNSKEYIDNKIKLGKAKILKTPKRNLKYDELLSELENHELLKSFSRRKNKGEIHSLAYAKLFNIPYFSTNDKDAIIVCNELNTFNSIKIIGLEVLLVIAEITLNFEDSKETRKIRRSLYKKYCRRNTLPSTYNEYCNTYNS